MQRAATPGNPGDATQLLIAHGEGRGASPGLFECLPHAEKVTDDGDDVGPAGGGLAAQLLIELCTLLDERREVAWLTKIVADQPAHLLHVGVESFTLVG